MANKRTPLNSIHEHENIITEHRKNKHDIQKYNFRNMEIPPKTEEQPIQSDQASPPEPIIQPIDTPPPPPNPSIDAPALKLFEAEVVDKILQKSDILAQSLQKLQEQFNTQESEMQEKISLAKAEAKEQGYNEGYQRAKQELEAQINSQKELYAISIQRINANIAESKNHILSLEKELSSIALDIAKEVITAEVNTHSAKIATALARTLLQDITQNVQVTLKVFPGDLEELKDSLKDLSNITLEADQAIAKGGVVILSNEGNIDGDIFMRFETLKKSILENKA